MINKLSHTTIYVLDQDQALDFYANKLGFEVRMDMTVETGFRWLTVGLKDQPDLDIALIAIKPDVVDGEASVEHMKALLAVGALGRCVFSTPDCHATYAEYTAKGVEFLSPPQEHPYGIDTSFKDPFGNVFTLTQLRS